jgi:hypothetical protein
MKLNTQHPLVLAVQDMGIDASHAAAALVGFARQNGCKAASLSVAQGLNSFVDYLFTHPPDATAVAQDLGHTTDEAREGETHMRDVAAIFDFERWQMLHVDSSASRQTNRAWSKCALLQPYAQSSL